MRRFLIVCAIALALAYVIGIPLFLGNDANALPRRVDAVVALSSSNSSVPVAQELVQKGLAPILVVSAERSERSKERTALCRTRPKHVICVNADPFTTSSETQVVARLANDHHWSTLVVVGPDYEQFRIQRSFERCPGLTVVMHSVDEPWWRSAIGIPLEWVKLAVAETVRRSC